MEREIKFKAWDKKDKRMIDLYKITPLILNEDIDGLFIPFDKRYKLMQYTGLKDKNGKEIFEGDVVKTTGWGDEPEIHEVKWFGDDGYPAFDLKPELDCEMNSFSMIENTRDVIIEIIGNIHENPELLKGG